LATFTTRSETRCAKDTRCIIGLASRAGEYEFFSAFLRCAFALGINLNRRKGLQQAVEMAGLDWSAAQHHVDDRSWEAALEVNRRAMYEAGLWGVPSFRLMDEEGKECLAIWGQDRLWLVAREIQRQLSARLN
jgi:2-hydroxychromene-2-carboxylate isomerase